jgi:hypothetical protein
MIEVCIYVNGRMDGISKVGASKLLGKWLVCKMDAITDFCKRIQSKKSI